MPSGTRLVETEPRRSRFLVWASLAAPVCDLFVMSASTAHAAVSLSSAPQTYITMPCMCPLRIDPFTRTARISSLSLELTRTRHECLRPSPRTQSFRTITFSIRGSCTRLGPLVPLSSFKGRPCGGCAIHRGPQGRWERH